MSDLDNLDQHDSDLKISKDIMSYISLSKNMASRMKIDNYKSVLSSDSWNTILKATELHLNNLSKDSFEHNELDYLADYLRFLRNLSGSGIAENQQFILSSNEIMDCVKKTINAFKDKKSEKEIVVLKCGIQVIGNLVSLSTEAKVLVWNDFLEQNIFQSLFEHDSHSVREYTMMVLFNCIRYDATAKHFISTRKGHQILISLLDSLCNDLVDWGILFLECILKQDSFFQNCYEIIPVKSRLLILDIIIQQLSSGSENDYFVVPQSSLNYIIDCFIQYIKKFIQICDCETAGSKTVEITKLLCLLGEASILDSYSQILKSNRDLLETALETLQSVHLLSKTSNSAFSCISDLHVRTDEHREDIENNPSYGFKKNLIRLIGNLCFNCKENQDTVRRLEGIPVLLDCCNIDARNPFILQWSILALRNIMEKNPQNQAFLTAVSASGEVNSAVFTELGFEVKKEDGKYILRGMQPEH